MAPMAAITEIHHPFLVSVRTEQALGNTGSRPQHVRLGVCMEPGSRRLGWVLHKKKHRGALVEEGCVLQLQNA